MTIEELEAKLEIVTKHRDGWKKMLEETNGHVRDLAALVEPGLNRHPITVIQAAQKFIRTLTRERDEARAEVATAYRRGAEAMREACARVADAHCVPGTRDVIRSLPIPQEP